MPMSIHIDQAVLESLQRHAVREYPDECCGILIGLRQDQQVHVTRVVEAKNIAEERRGQRYQIDWKTLFSTLRAVRNQPEDFVGFYHSHPDGSVSPSERDRERAWINFSYVILTMVDGRCADVTGWRIPVEGASFDREDLTPPSGVV